MQKVERIIREELDRVGCQEVLLPIVWPAELWQESGRWDLYGKELLRIKDRHDREFCLGPTHEEVMTDLVRRDVRSYRELPLNLYQIQTKFRDEIRPRFGLMRGREFLMKDGYSFHADYDDCRSASTSVMREAYSRIFRRCGLRFRAVEADTGAIGGSRQHEFQVLADSGEDADRQLRRAASTRPTSRRRSTIPCDAAARPARDEPLAEVATPGRAHDRGSLGVPRRAAERFLKTLILVADDKGVAALVRGDDQLSETKLKAAARRRPRCAWPKPTRSSAAPARRRVSPGRSACELPLVRRPPRGRHARGMVTGANKADTHVTGVGAAARLPGRRVRRPAHGARRRRAARAATAASSSSTAASKSGRSSISARSTAEKLRRDVPRRRRQRAGDGDGHLRHRRDAHDGRGHRAEPRRQAASSGRSRSRRSKSIVVPVKWDDEASRARPPSARRASSRPPASTCCSTTATSAPASSSTTPTCSASRCRVTIGPRGLAARQRRAQGARAAAAEDIALDRAAAAEIARGDRAAHAELRA